MDNFFSKAPEIIREAAKSPLGVVSLIIILISLLALSFFTTASEPIRVGIFILIFVGASVFIANLLRHAKSENSQVLPTARQLSTSDSSTSDTQLLQWPKNVSATCIQDGVAYFLLTEKGEFVGDLGPCVKLQEVFLIVAGMNKSKCTMPFSKNFNVKQMIYLKNPN